jgi:pimeloyl-ACP methyl ester carboxylesterase
MARAVSGSRSGTYVLVHGGGHGAWCWESMVPWLSRPALAVDLPGRADKPGDLATLRIADFADSVVRDIDRAGLDKVVLVGHSMAGVVLPAVANLLGERTVHMVFISSAIPPEGGRVVDTISPALRWCCVRAYRRGSRQLVFPRWMSSILFCNDMDRHAARRVLDRLSPDAMGVTLERVTRNGYCSSVSRTFIKLLRDRTIAPRRQDRMIENLGGADVLTLDAGHDAMISRPRELAALVDRATHAAVLEGYAGGAARSGAT